MAKDAPPLPRAPGAPFRAWWLGQSDNLRGAMFVVVSCASITTMAMLVKLAGGRLDSFQLAFLRALFGTLIVLPLVVAAGLRVLQTRRVGLHLARGLAGSVAMMCGFYALTRLPLADVTAIGYTKPLFLIVLAALVLRETVRARRWTATAVGFAGVLIMLRPGDGVLAGVALIALAGALGAAVVTLLVKRLTSTEAPLTIMAWLALIQLTVCAGPAAWVWQTPSLTELGIMAAAAGFASLGQLCLIRGYRLGEASVLAPFEYARLPVAALYGLLLFDETLDLYTLAGASLIVASTLYIARREAQLGKSPAVPRTTPEA